MSSFSKLTKHPKTGVWHVADWLDDFFGQHNYGVRFPNGEVFDPRKTNLETKDGGLFKATEPAEFVKECRKEAEQSMKEVKEQLEPKPQEGNLMCPHKQFLTQTCGRPHYSQFQDLDCPFCASRPKELQDREMLAWRLAETSIVKGDATCNMSVMEKARILADIAIAHLKEKEGR